MRNPRSSAPRAVDSRDKIAHVASRTSCRRANAPAQAAEQLPPQFIWMHPKNNELCLMIKTWRLTKISKAYHHSRTLKEETKNTEKREVLLCNWLFSQLLSQLHCSQGTCLPDAKWSLLRAGH